MPLSAPASMCFNVAGPLQIWVNTGTSAAMEQLGWTAEGISIEEIQYHVPLYSDRVGGPNGAPEDYQLFGGQHRISGTLVKWDAAILAKMANRILATGTRKMGMLIGCSSNTIRALFYSGDGTTHSYIRNYNFITIPDPQRYDRIGSNASQFQFTWTGNQSTSDNGITYAWDSRVALTAPSAGADPTSPYGT